MYELGLDRGELARACVRAENDVVGAATGGMDQLASLFGEEGHALLVDMRDGALRQVPLPLTETGLRLLVIDTRVRHHLADGQYGQRRAAVEKAADVLGLPSLRDATPEQVGQLDGELQKRARHIVTEIARVREVVAALDAGRLAEIGPLLDASHRSLASDYEVSCAELDLACDSRALGGRARGADDRRRVRRVRDRAGGGGAGRRPRAHGDGGVRRRGPARAGDPRGHPLGGRHPPDLSPAPAPPQPRGESHDSTRRVGHLGT